MRDAIDTGSESAGRSGTLGGMKVVVLGATGATGLEIVRQAIEHGHSVTAFVRSPERLKPFEDRITVKQGMKIRQTEFDLFIRLEELLICTAQEERFKHARAHGSCREVGAGDQTNSPHAAPSVVQRVKQFFALVRPVVSSPAW